MSFFDFRVGPWVLHLISPMLGPVLSVVSQSVHTGIPIIRCELTHYAITFRQKPCMLRSFGSNVTNCSVSYSANGILPTGGSYRFSYTWQIGFAYVSTGCFHDYPATRAILVRFVVVFYAGCAEPPSFIDGTSPVLLPIDVVLPPYPPPPPR